MKTQQQMSDISQNGQTVDVFMPPQLIIRKIICVASGLILPAILIPIVSITGFSEVVEEIAKAVVIGFVILTLPKFGQRLRWTIIFSLLFGISESMFYLSHIVAIGNYSIFASRLFFTVPMHVITAVTIFLLGTLRKKYIIIGLILACIIHLVFNYAVMVRF